jgi:NitT/TauT family transport system ATP-binding protein
MTAPLPASAAVEAPGTGTKPFVSVAGLTKRFSNGSTVLDDISLDLARGDFVSLIGPSGCGKSTLLKLVSGLSPVSGGGITVDGMTPENARELMSFIFQDATLLPWRTVIGNIELGLELEGGTTRPQRLAKAVELLGLVGLSDVADHYPRQLSGGMKMRVSIARALATRPKLLLMDEPFGALDEMTRDHLNEELLRLREEQKWTTLFVTHSVAEAVFLSTRVVVLQARPGRIRRDIAVPFPFPRLPNLRSDPAYLDLVGQVSQALRDIRVGPKGGEA